LAVAVDKSNKVKSVVDGIMEPNFLVSAIALVDGIEQYGDRETGIAIESQLMSLGKSLIVGAVINDQDFRIVLGERRGNPANNLLYSALCIVGDNEDEYPSSNRMSNACLI